MHKVLHAIWIMIVCCITCCQAVDNPCEDLQPCKNGGTCNVTQEPPGYSCQCASPFEGTNCTAVGHIIQAGNSIEFNCIVESIETSQWRVQRPDGSFTPIAQNGQVYSSLMTKFNLSVYNQSSGRNLSYNLSLTVVEVNGDDDGTYRCEEDGQVRTQENLIVEVPPVLHLEKDGISVHDSTIHLPFGEEVTIVCKAGGDPKPPVNISMRVKGNKGTRSYHPPETSEGGVATFRYVPLRGDSILTCVSSGQKVVPEQVISVRVKVQYPPDYCVIDTLTTRNEHSITCKCGLSNPVVNAYEIYVNGALNSTRRNIILPSDTAATVFCIAKNNVGSSKSDLKKLEPFPEEIASQHKGLIIAQSVIGVIAFFFIISGVTSCAVFGFIIYKFYKYLKQ